jgi:NADH-dependent formate dehydrogenase delta subunit FdsD
MDIPNLVKMANQIGQFFAAWPDPDAARKEVANHLTRFWDPRMRAALLAHVDATAGASGLDPLVAEAVSLLIPCRNAV